MDWIEWFGYLASVVVAVSLTMQSLVKLRWINLVGALLFSIYGLMIGALPVAALNGFIVIANLYYLLGIYTSKDQFQLLEVKVDDPMVGYWLEHNAKDISLLYPKEQEFTEPGSDCLLLMRNQMAIGLFTGSQQGEAYRVSLDYVFPAYRDFKTGEFLYHASGYFKGRGIQRILAAGQSAEHRKYLSRMGFVADSAEPELFELKIG